MPAGGTVSLLRPRQLFRRRRRAVQAAQRRGSRRPAGLRARRQTRCGDLEAWACCSATSNSTTCSRTRGVPRHRVGAAAGCARCSPTGASRWTPKPLRLRATSPRHGLTGACARQAASRPSSSAGPRRARRATSRRWATCPSSCWGSDSVSSPRASAWASARLLTTHAGHARIGTLASQACRAACLWSECEVASRTCAVSSRAVRVQGARGLAPRLLVARLPGSAALHGGRARAAAARSRVRDRLCRGDSRASACVGHAALIRSGAPRACQRPHKSRPGLATAGCLLFAEVPGDQA